MSRKLPSPRLRSTASGQPAETCDWEAPLPFTHFDRYRLAARLATGRALDLGCGSGYGSAMLARHSRWVVGVDRDTRAVSVARERFTAAPCCYLTADAGRLPLPGGSFDLVVCFGLLEELTEAAAGAILDECRRVLAASGLLLLSVPEGTSWQRASGLERLRRLVEPRFAHLRLFGRGREERGASWRRPESTAAALAPGGAAVHLIAIGSHRALPDGSVPANALALPVDLNELGEELLRDEARRELETRVIFEKVVEDLRARLEAFDARIRRLGREIEHARGDQVRAGQRQAELEERLRAVEGERAALTETLGTIHASKMWSLWMGYHGLRQFLARPGPPLAAFARRIGVELPRKAAGRLLRAARGLAWRARAFAGRARRGTAARVRRLPHTAGWLYLAVVAPLRRRRAQALLASASPPAPLPAPAFLGPYGRRPRVLMVVPYPIHPPNHGGAVRVFNLIREIAPHVDLHLVVFSRDADDGPQAAALAPFCASVTFQPWTPAWRPDRWGLLPPGAQLFRSAEAAARLRHLAEVHDVDVLQLEYTELGQYAGVAPNAHTILTEIDITFRSRERRRAAGFDRRYTHDHEFGWSDGDLRRLFHFEIAACRRAEQVHVMSEVDGAYLAAFLPDGGRRVRVVPNAVDTLALRPPRAAATRRGVLFLGNFQHLPNVDACDFLLAEIWPRVRARRPEAELSVVGAHVPDSIAASDGAGGVRVAGTVAEVLPHYQGHELLVAPIRAGSGTRLKILEAMACGLPVVSTRLGAEGIAAADGEHLLLADGAEAIADAVVRLLEDAELRRRLGVAGRALVEARYDWRRSGERLLEAYRELLPVPDRWPQGATEAAEERERRRRRRPGEPVVSVIVPTLDGGPVLDRALAAIFTQRLEVPFEVICVDSTSAPEHRAILDRHPVRVETVARREFNHGLTRDLGARVARGDVLVFLNQDAVPCDAGWLARLAGPLLPGERGVAGVQGGIRELPDPGDRFYWDSCGERFYFTRESQRWIARYGGIGFSTVNAALRRSVWERHPFGFAPIMEDKKWQREVVEAGYRIVARHDACVFHTHTYELGSLARRCVAEGWGWRFVGDPYRLVDALRDLGQTRMWADLARGVAAGRVKNFAELGFPWLRPLFLYHGSRFARGVGG